MCKEKSLFLLKKTGSALYVAGSNLTIIFSFTTSIRISLLHFGQYRGKFTITVS